MKLISDRFVQGADGVKVLAPTSAIDAAFGYFAFKAVQLPDRGYSRHFKFVRATRFPVPPLAEQRRIVAKIEALMARSRRAEEALSEIPPLIERHREAVLAAAFRGDLTAEWRAQNRDVEPASALLERIRTERQRRWEEAELVKLSGRGKATPRYVAPAKARPLHSGAPAGWVWASSDEMFVFVTSGSRGWSKYYAKSGAHFIRVGNLDRLRLDIDWTNDQRVRPPSGAEGLRTRVEPNDLLISITADIGMVAVAPSNLPEAYVNQHVALARPALPDTARYLAWYIASQEGQKQLGLFERGATKAGLGLDDIRSVEVPLPPYGELCEAVDLIDRSFQTLDSISRIVAESTARLPCIDQSILAKAFRGELVPQDSRDEPASVLLERIRAESADMPKQKRQIRQIGATKMPSKPTRLPIVDVLAEQTAPLTPEELFQMAGFESERVDDFYTEIKAAVEAGQITQDSRKRLAMVR